MPDQVFIYYIEDLLVILSIKSGCWGTILIRLDMKFGKLVKMALKGGSESGVDESGKRYVAPVCV
jgi:hypothetical protein